MKIEWSDGLAIKNMLESSDEESFHTALAIIENNYEDYNKPLFFAIASVLSPETLSKILKSNSIYRKSINSSHFYPGLLEVNLILVATLMEKLSGDTNEIDKCLEFYKSCKKDYSDFFYERQKSYTY